MIANAARVSIKYSNGVTSPAYVARVSNDTDLALIHVDHAEPNQPTLTLASVFWSGVKTPSMTFTLISGM